jgi:hypothetical protein
MNRLLPWIVNRFELRGIFLIIRHPCAVVASQLKTGLCGYRPISPPYTDIFPTVDMILEEASQINGLDSKLIERLQKIKTLEEILAAAWCLDTIVPFQMANPLKWSLIIYEKLVKDGNKELTRIIHELGEEKIPRSAVHQLKKPSMLADTKDHHLIQNPERQLAKWKQSLSDTQIKRILNIVAEFGLDFYSEDVEPDYKKITTKFISY